MGHLRSLLVALSLLVLLTPSSIGAQDATPTPSTTLPISPNPARCTVVPHDKAELDALYTEVNPDGVELQPLGTPPPAVVSEDQPVDAETQAAITDLIVLVLACSANGNNGLADATLLTQEHLVDNLRTTAREDYDAFYTETAVPNPPENWLMLYALHDFRMLPDGRVAVNPDVIVPGVGRFIDTLILEQVDGQWLIDYSLEGEGNLYGKDVPGQ